uniref:uncharacterized protein LOC105350250 n=1 Tax=Fragaria vesca subsp. vesca TaxID=101020 RepID=UPI0005C9A6A6|nr:PREDICTED: uncharacterized protein LOC105350250 [Fragaria vesca subsp. vesca]
MDSALCLHHGALRIPSTTRYAAGLARPYSSFRPSSLSLVSKASTYRTQAQHSFTSPLICALNNPIPPSPNYDKDNGKNIVLVVGCASVVLACVLGVINCKSNFSIRATAAERRPRATDSLTQEGDTLVLSRPKGVLNSLLRLNRPLAIQKGKWYSSTPKLEIPDELPERPTQEDREKLKTAVAHLIQSGKCNEAETQLKALLSKTKGGEPARDVEMELVPVLIFQEKYEEALQCNCLRDDSRISTDGRDHFYKAIIHTMLGQDVDAVKCWNTFVSSFSNQDMLNAPSEVTNRKTDRILR